MIRCNDLTLGYEGKTIASNITFTVGEGDFLCIIGENGSGKTTLLRTLLGLQKPISGTLTVADGRRGIGYLPQQDAIARDFPASVWEVVLGGCIGHMGIWIGEKERQRARDAIAAVGMNGNERKSYRTLSGGQQQRTLLARALCAADRLLLLDEPTASLDPEAAAQLYAVLHTLHRQGMTVVMITHDIDPALTDATHVLRIGRTGAHFYTKADYQNAKGEEYNV